MAECKHCGGTGLSFGKYCTCSNGKFKRTHDKAVRKAAETIAKEKEAKKEAKQLQVEIEISPATPKKSEFEIGDWVELSSGLVCWVEQIDPGDGMIRVKAIRDRNGEKASGYSWVKQRALTKMKNQDFDNMSLESVLNRLDDEWLKVHIDKALDAKDYKLFKKLVAMMPQPLPF